MLAFSGVTHFYFTHPPPDNFNIFWGIYISAYNFVHLVYIFLKVCMFPWPGREGGEKHLARGPASTAPPHVLTRKLQQQRPLLGAAVMLDTFICRCANTLSDETLECRQGLFSERSRTMWKCSFARLSAASCTRRLLSAGRLLDFFFFIIIFI